MPAITTARRHAAIQISDDNPTDTAGSHFRNVKVIDNKGAEAGSREPRWRPGQIRTAKSVRLFHDWYGPGRQSREHEAKDLLGDGNDYGEEVD